MQTLDELERRRAFECRLTPDRALDTLDDAAAFLDDRGLLTLTPDCSLPSLFGACHEEPYSDAPGFGSWPKTKYGWSVTLPALATRLHRGKRLFLSDATARIADPLCRAELAAAETGEQGEEAARLVAHLAAGGPALFEELKEELGLERRVRDRLERVGAVVSRSVMLQEPHSHTSELSRWDQAVAAAPAGHAERALVELLAAGVRAAVLVPAPEVRTWFSWRLGDAVEHAVEAGLVVRPGPGLLAAP
jgi:hypothetical protein